MPTALRHNKQAADRSAACCHPCSIAVQRAGGGVVGGGGGAPPPPRRPPPVGAAATFLSNTTCCSAVRSARISAFRLVLSSIIFARVASSGAPPAAFAAVITSRDCA